MVFDQTQQQSGEEQTRARALSLKRCAPDRCPRLRAQAVFGGRGLRRSLGGGRYQHRPAGGDQVLRPPGRPGLVALSREVEKLVFLSADRYVVQLLDVGWDAEPPYYVMEYLEHGSLKICSREGRLAVDQAVGLFRDVAVGLLHAHGKGVLHCDLKPANVLLDQDSQPRLADFGQSRLRTSRLRPWERCFSWLPSKPIRRRFPTSAGTSTPWGPCSIRCSPVRRRIGAKTAVTEIESADPFGRPAGPLSPVDRNGPAAVAASPVAGGRSAGRDRRSLPGLESRRAFRERAGRARCPVGPPGSPGPLATGAVGGDRPAAVLLVMSLFAWWSFDLMLDESDDSLQTAFLDSNSFAAKLVAEKVTNELETRYAEVEEIASSSRFQAILETALDDADLSRLRCSSAARPLPAEERAACGPNLSIIRPAKRCSSGWKICAATKPNR